jgi:hypothetical protein
MSQKKTYVLLVADIHSFIKLMSIGPLVQELAGSAVSERHPAFACVAL